MFGCCGVCMLLCVVLLCVVVCCFVVWCGVVWCGVVFFFALIPRVTTALRHRPRERCSAYPPKRAASDPFPSERGGVVATVRRANSSLREVCHDCICDCRGARPGGGHLSCQPRPQSRAFGAGLQTGSGTPAWASAAARERLTPRSAVHVWCVGGWRRFPASRVTGRPIAPVL